MAMPAAPYASAATSTRPSWKPPAATTGISTASTTCGSSTVVATSPVWPPPQPPCTITASAPQAATFSACRRAPPTAGTTTTPASFSSAISSREGARAKDATRTPSSTMIRTRRPRPRRRRAGDPPNGASVRDLTSRMACSQMVEGHRLRGGRDPSAPAFAADTRRPATQPIPVCTTG